MFENVIKELKLLPLLAGFGQFWSYSNRTHNIAISTYPVDTVLLSEAIDFCKQHKCKLGIDNVYYDKNSNSIKSNSLFGIKTLFLVIKDDNTFLFASMIWDDYHKSVIDKINILKNIK